MEKFFYEARPYFFLLVGIVGLIARQSPLMLASSALLVAAALHVCRARAYHRGIFAYNVRIRR